MTISFEYCLVRIRRPWWMDAFTNEPAWYIPIVAAGGITAPGNPAVISSLPVAFLPSGTS